VTANQIFWVAVMLKYPLFIVLVSAGLLLAPTASSREGDIGAGRSSNQTLNNNISSTPYQVERSVPRTKITPHTPPERFHENPNKYQLNNYELNRQTPYDKNQYNKDHRSNNDPYVRKYRLSR
jgi:hypothetical protein